MISVEILSQLTSDTACAVYSNEGAILRANEAFGRLLNLPAERLRGTKLWDLIVGLQEEEFEAYLARFSLGQAVEDSTVYQGAEIRQRPVSTLTVPFRTAGEIHYLLFVRPLKQGVENSRDRGAPTADVASRTVFPSPEFDQPKHLSNPS